MGIVRDFGLTHVSSGDLLRANLRDGTPLGLEAKAYMAKGDLVPDSVMVGLVAGELKKLEAEPWLLDGFPRTQAQAKALQEETPVNVVINRTCPSRPSWTGSRTGGSTRLLAGSTTWSSILLRLLERMMRPARILCRGRMTRPSR